MRYGIVAAAAAFASLVSAAAPIEVFHADSLAGPMSEMKKAFEAKHPGATVNLTPGVSRELAARILKGERCDVFASSSPAVIDQDLMKKPLPDGKEAASWYVVFSANEMVIVTPRGNPRAVHTVADLAKPDVKFVRVTGEKDLATARTMEFLKRAAAMEGNANVVPAILEKAPADPSKPTGVPDVVAAVREGRAHAAVVYYSAAVAARNDLDIVRFPEKVNLSEAIRNAAVVPGTARNPDEAMAFVAWLISDEGREILKATGQPPVAPPIRKGEVPAGIR